MMLDTVVVLTCIVFVIAIFRKFPVNQRRHNTQANSSATHEETSSYVHGSWGLLTMGGASFDSRPIFPRRNVNEHRPRNVTPRRVIRERFHQQISPLSSIRIGRGERGTLVEEWRKSIVGLVRLADKNLEFAKENIKMGDYKAACRCVFTSVENIAPALIHCCGGKPDSGSGQEEALRMLSRRFKENEKSEFEKTLNVIACLNCKRRVLTDNLTQNPQASMFDREKTKRTLESASKTVSQFKRIITKYFADEIPDLPSA